MLRAGWCLFEPHASHPEGASHRGRDTVRAWRCQRPSVLPKLRVAGSIPVSRSNFPKSLSRLWLGGVDAYGSRPEISPERGEYASFDTWLSY
jgi:hypothetical protein